jgi:adenylate cyclase
VSEKGRQPGRLRRAASTVAISARRFDGHPKVLTAAKLAREFLPGDSRFGDPLSTAGREQPHIVGRRLAELTAERPGVMREAGLSALQVWQGISEAQGRGRGDKELTIAFTDLADFSDWALEAGDDAALDLLRDVGQTLETPVKAHGGEIVKWLGDGTMTVFEEPDEAIEALLDAVEGVQAVEADGYEPRLRVGIHVGRPRRLGGDYLGVDVNVAARVAEEASAGELLVSGRALEHVDADELEVRERKHFGVKGVPKDVTAYAVSRR